VISRAELLQEIADAMRREGEQQGIIIVSGYIARSIDDICGNDFMFKWPFPGPRPNWLAKEVSGIDLVVMATQLDQTANETFNRELRQNLANASANSRKQVCRTGSSLACFPLPQTTKTRLTRAYLRRSRPLRLRAGGRQRLATAPSSR
jgi:hypothetical protein